MSAETSSRFINVDELMPQVTVEQVAAFYGVNLPDLGRVGAETRVACFLNCGRTQQTGDRAIAIQTDHPAKQWKCHHYGCGKGGNLVSLCDLLKPGPNMGGRPRGDRFKAIAADLRMMVEGTLVSPSPAAAPVAPAAPAPEVPKVNVPLAKSDNERARGLVDLDRKFVVDPAEMPPAASGYFRRRPFLTSEVCRKWRMGYLPRSAGEDRSGGTMRGMVVYPFLSEAGEVLTWFGRDPSFEEKHQALIGSLRIEAAFARTRTPEDRTLASAATRRRLDLLAKVRKVPIKAEAPGVGGGRPRGSRAGEVPLREGISPWAGVVRPTCRSGQGTGIPRTHAGYRPDCRGRPQRRDRPRCDGRPGGGPVLERAHEGAGSDYSRDGRPERATGVAAGTSVARRPLNQPQDVPVPCRRLRCSGNLLRDLVPAYANNPGRRRSWCGLRGWCLAGGSCSCSTATRRVKPAPGSALASGNWPRTAMAGWGGTVRRTTATAGVMFTATVSLSALTATSRPASTRGRSSISSKKPPTPVFAELLAKFLATALPVKLISSVDPSA